MPINNRVVDIVYIHAMLRTTLAIYGANALPMRAMNMARHLGTVARCETEIGRERERAISIMQAETAINIKQDASHVFVRSFSLRSFARLNATLNITYATRNGLGSAEQGRSLSGEWQRYRGGNA